MARYAALCALFISAHAEQGAPPVLFSDACIGLCPGLASVHIAPPSAAPGQMPTSAQMEEMMNDVFGMMCEHQDDFQCAAANPDQCSKMPDGTRRRLFPMLSDADSSVPDEHRRLSMGLPVMGSMEPSMLTESMDCFCSACPCVPAALAKFVGAKMETVMAMMASVAILSGAGTSYTITSSTGASYIGVTSPGTGATYSVGNSPGTGLATSQEEMAKKMQEATCGLMNTLTCVHSQSSCAAFATGLQHMTGEGPQQGGSQMSMSPQLALPALDNQSAMDEMAAQCESAGITVDGSCTDPLLTHAAGQRGAVIAVALAAAALAL